MRRTLKTYSQTPITHSILSEVLAEYRRPNDKISQLLQSGQLISLRRGLYVPGPDLDLPTPHHFLIANHLRGPSYVSLETALSHWGMIPERVYTISSATLKTSKEYQTEMGRFEYRYLPSPYYAFGLRSVQLSERQVVLIASPEKALCDKIVLTSGINLRSMTQTQSFLFDDLRLDEEAVFNLDAVTISTWLDDAPKSSSLEMLLKTLQRL